MKILYVNIRKMLYLNIRNDPQIYHVMCRTSRNDIFEDHCAFSYIIFEDHCAFSYIIFEDHCAFSYIIFEDHLYIFVL